jgi:hypothetical protein
VDDAIRESRAILEMPLDPEDDNSPRLEESTWRRATNFLRTLAKSIWDLRGGVVAAPEIVPVPDGSIDLHWKSENYELLVNIPRDEVGKAQFYGDEAGKTHFKGTLDVNEPNLHLILWLATR